MWTCQVMGYLLPWGQMSYWGAQVIISLFGAIPVVGEDIVQWIRGDYLVSDATINRFFALHALTNAIVTITAVPDTVRTALDPVSSMEGRCNVIPACVGACNMPA